MLKYIFLGGRLLTLFQLVCLFFLSSSLLALAASNDQLHSVRTQLPVTRYLALGDSLAYGYQPNNDHSHGYADDLSSILGSQGVTDHLNLGCPGETTSTFISSGKCSSSQLSNALAYLQQQQAGQATFVTLSIGADDVLGDVTINYQNKACVIDVKKFYVDLQTIDQNLTQTILPQLQTAMKSVNGQRSASSLVLLNYYNPLQNICANTTLMLQVLNAHLANDVKGFGSLVDVFAAFGGTATPNSNICIYTWICSSSPGPDIHPTIAGYQVMAQAVDTLYAQSHPSVTPTPSVSCANGYHADPNNPGTCLPNAAYYCQSGQVWNPQTNSCIAESTNPNQCNPGYTWQDPDNAQDCLPVSQKCGSASTYDPTSGYCIVQPPKTQQ